MKVSSQSLPAAAEGRAKPEAMEPAKPATAGVDKPAAGDRHGPAVEITLSDEAKAKGKSAQSPAHQARAFLAEHPELAGQPFGKLVSQLAKGGTIDVPEGEDTAPAGGDTAEAPATEPTADGITTVLDEALRDEPA